ncbi:MAG: TAT-variant-translocated molybdopterin oxidoreductase, partial [Bdellovibrionaceae bacterium]|nr:TAT-variant-translocated molybdopterin oxidoreductase [Pseudobdellovibrionaceae bacterium]
MENHTDHHTHMHADQHHAPVSPSSDTPSEFWLGLEDYEGSAEFKKLAENEFLTSPLKSEDGKDGVARRDFLKLMGASLALATTSCVRRPAQKIIPYAQAPKEITPGEANFYASSWFDGIEGYGVVVKTLEGRPIKMEGNPLHPVNKGGLTARAHAEILALYDPDRLKGPVRNLVNKTRTNKETIKTTWAVADEKVLAQFAKGGVAILTGYISSPSTRAMIDDFSSTFGGARHYHWDPMGLDAVAEGSRRSYGRAVVPRYRLNQAKMVVSVDADMIGTYISPAEFGKMISEGRRPGANMMRMVAFESNVSLTGLNADDRIRIKPSQQLDVVLGLIYEVGVNLAKHPVALSARHRTFLDGYKDIALALGMEPALFKKIAAQLWENRGQSLVIAGGLPTLTNEAVDLQVAVNMLNSILDNDGATVDHANGYDFISSSDPNQPNEMASLMKDMSDGKVQTLIIHGVNPVYAFGDSAAFAAAAAKVAMVISTANWNDETASLADFVLPSGLSMEAWGDHEFKPGVYSIQQPTITPLHDSRSFEESLFAWASAAPKAPTKLASLGSWYEYVRNTWRTQVMPKAGANSFDDLWLEALHSGIVDTAKGRGAGGARALASDALNVQPRAKQSGY